jgi:IclR family acetate operon transcriptional repressor
VRRPAAYSDDSVTGIIQRHGLTRLTPKSIVRPGKLREVLAEIRAQGYALDDEEHAIGLRCVAAAIYDEHSEPLAALSASGPTARISDRRIPELGRIVASAASDITAALGGRVLRP